MLSDNQLITRIITSIILICIVAAFILINKFFFYVGLLTISSICFFEWININKPYFKKKKNKIKLIYVIGLSYIIIFFIASIVIYTEISKFFLIFIILICAASDVGGYIFGKIIGGIKLTKISPKKTISGSLGSFIFSLVPLLLFSYKKNEILNLDLSFYNISFCLIISLSCQCGDLVISYFKRLNKVKDTGKILPGHGGLLDRVDGIIFAVPSALLLLTIYSF